MCDETDAMTKDRNERKTQTMNQKKLFGLCSAGLEILNEAMMTKEGKRILTSKRLGLTMNLWLFGKTIKCSKETDGLR